MVNGQYCIHSIVSVVDGAVDIMFGWFCRPTPKKFKSKNFKIARSEILLQYRAEHVTSVLVVTIFLLEWMLSKQMEIRTIGSSRSGTFYQ
jgi:hypothetical protein